MRRLVQQIRTGGVVQRTTLLVLAGFTAICSQRVRAAQEFTWPKYNPTVAYDYQDEFGILKPPTKVLDDVSGVAGTYTNGWWCFRWGENKNPEVSKADWVPMIDRLNKDFGYITDVMRWPRDLRARSGYYSAVYLFGSGLSTDSASDTALGGWMGSVHYQNQDWPMILASYYPVHCFDPAYTDSDKKFQMGGLVHEGIHSILASMPGCKHASWFHEGGNTWLQGTMEAQRTGTFNGIGWLSVGSMLAPFMPIECYSGWLQDGSFGGPSAEGVNRVKDGKPLCTWRNVLGGVQYSECFPHALEVILGPESVAWVWRNCSKSGRVLQDLAEVKGGLGVEQTRRLILEYRARQAFCDFGPWSYAFRQLLDKGWGLKIGPERDPKLMDCPVWNATCYAATTLIGHVLKPDRSTLPGWSGANQIPLKVNLTASSATVDFMPSDEQMGCLLVYRDTDGNIHYSQPVKRGNCSIPLKHVLNNVVVAVICNMNYIYEGEDSRIKKYDYRLGLGAGISGAADIHTRWYDFSPSSYCIKAATGPKGSIQPEGRVTVDDGAQQSFTFVPAPDDEVDQVLLNGFPIGAMKSYTFNDVHGDYTIAVTFKRK